MISTDKLIEVSFSDIDALHIVWHGKYVKYFEDAREHFGKRYKISYVDFLDKGYLTPLVDLQLTYKKMVRYGETLRVNVIYKKVAVAKIIFEYRIYNEQDNIVCTGKSIQVITTTDKDLVLTKPDFLKKWEDKWFK